MRIPYRDPCVYWMWLGVCICRKRQNKTGENTPAITNFSTHFWQSRPVLWCHKPAAERTGIIRLSIVSLADDTRFRYKWMQIHDVLWKGEADSSQLPPCHATLRLHVLRAKYQAAIWRRSCQAQMNIPTLNGNGWNLDSESNLAIQWMTGMQAPQAALDVLSCDYSQSRRAAAVLGMA